ncbi:hypothetical protein V1511DRAFT_458922 [Dipodascopsis uninucleata]
MEVYLPQNLMIGKDAENALKDDSEFIRFSWESLRDIIENNELQKLMRLPSDLRQYLLWKSSVVETYGSVVNYVIKMKLQWTSEDLEEAKSYTQILSNRDLYKILLNDFPYGLEKGIIHVVVWSKIRIPDHKLDSANGMSRETVTDEARALIEDFLEANFVKQLGMSREDILWFKNWAVLMSIRDIDHFHVLLRRPRINEQLLDLLKDDTNVIDKLKKFTRD